MSEYQEYEEATEEVTEEVAEEVTQESEYDVLEDVADPAVEPEIISPKSRLVTALLTFFLGEWGVDLFYKGKIGLGILQACLCLLLGLCKLPFIIGALIVIWVPVAGWIAAGVLCVVILVISIPGFIWPLVRFILALCGKSTDKQGRKIKNWKK